MLEIKNNSLSNSYNTAFGKCFKNSPMAFKGLCYAKKLDNDELLFHKTEFFRVPELIKFLPQYIKGRFPEGTTVHVGACSFGHDPVSIAMAMVADKSLDFKRYPIVASDINPDVVDIANSGVLELTPSDIEKAQSVVPDALKYLKCTTQVKDQNKLKDYIKNLVNKHFLKKYTVKGVTDYLPVMPDKVKTDTVFELSDELLANITFKTSDFTKEQFNKPSLIVFRNALQHFSAQERRDFLNNLYQTLQPGSTLVIGEGDICREVGYFLIDAGFKPLNSSYNRDLYKGNKTNRTPWKPFLKDPKLYIFEKN